MSDMPTLHIELEGVKQSMVLAIMRSQKEIQAMIEQQLRQCLSELTPETILLSVRRAFNEAVFETVKELAPELVENAVSEFFTTGEGSQIVKDALMKKFGV